MGQNSFCFGLHAFLLGKKAAGKDWVSVKMRKFLQYFSRAWGLLPVLLATSAISVSSIASFAAILLLLLSVIKGIETEWNLITGPCNTVFFSFTLFFSASKRVKASRQAKFSISVILASARISSCVSFRCSLCFLGPHLLLRLSSSCRRFLNSSLTSWVDLLNVRGSEASKAAGVEVCLDLFGFGGWMCVVEGCSFWVACMKVRGFKVL